MPPSTLTHPNTDTQHPERVTSTPTRKQVVERILSETSLDRAAIHRGINWLNDALMQCRMNNGYLILAGITIEQHAFLAAVVPARTSAAPGSLQSLVEQHLLTDAEVGVWHDIDRHTQDCCVSITMTSVDATN